MLTELLIIDGRMGRARYMRMSLLALLLMTLGAIMLIFPWVMSRVNGVELVPLGLSTFFGLGQIALGSWIAVSSSIRRLHDMGWHTLWLCLCAVPVEIIAIPAVVILSLAMSFVRGAEDANAHGPARAVTSAD